MNSSNPPPLADAHEVAEFLGIKHNTVEKWRYQSRGPAYYKIRGRVFYDWNDVYDWLEQYKKIPTEQHRVGGRFNPIGGRFCVPDRPNPQPES